MRRRPLTRILAAAGIAVTTLLSLPGLAAATPLPPYPGRSPSGALPVINGDVAVGDPINGPHDWAFTTQRPYWTLVTTHQGPTWDFDLAVYQKAGENAGTRLASSALPQGLDDFVAIDSNIRSPQSYVARVSKYTGNPTPNDWEYTLRLNQGDTVLGRGRTELDTRFNHFSYVRDVWIAAHQTATLTISPNSGVCFPSSPSRPESFEAFLMASDPANPASAVQRRTEAAASTRLNITGTIHDCAMTLTYTAPRSAFYGLVLVLSYPEFMVVDYN
jgi:hypothetical protein